jgi:hypothetical protein
MSSSCILPGSLPLEQTTNAILPSIPRWFEAFATLSFHDSSFAAIFQLSSKPAFASSGHGDIGMKHLLKACCFVGLLASVQPAAAQAADEYKLSNNQRISCGRGLSAGKLSTATCRSYAYVFNAKTSEYFRCSVSMSLTRDNKEVISNQSEGGCVKKPRIFDNDSNYSFDATETEPPNTNSFFGQGGYAVWASDNTARKVRGCIIISSGLGSDVTKCIDMKFE